MVLGELESKLKQDFRDRLNESKLRLGILIQREAVLSDYLREDMTSKSLGIDEKRAVELLLNIVRNESETIKEKRLKIIARLETVNTHLK